jgi:hypothetical protein
MKAVASHAVLLAVALGAAYLTWTRGSEAPPAPGSVELWEGEPEQVEAIRFAGLGRRVAVERRSDDRGSHFWAVVTPLDPDSAVQLGQPARTEFLVGEQGDELVRGLAAPRALRDLGAVDAEREREYGFAERTSELEVDVDGETHRLIVGGFVFGTGDRYAKVPESGRVYVLQSTLFPMLEAPETLTERRLHTFMPEDVGIVVLHASGGERTMRRASSPTGVSSWAPADTPDRPDQTFATFMERVQQLWAEQYAPQVDRSGLRELMRLDYQSESGEPLGYLALLRSEGATPEYFLISEHTRVPVRAFAGAADALARDVEQLFGGTSAAAAAEDGAPDPLPDSPGA